MAALTLQQAFEAACQANAAGRAGEAEHLARLIVAKDPRHAEALNLLAGMLADSGRGEEALDLARRAVAAAPAHGGLLLNLALLLAQEGLFSQATAAYQKLLALAPGFAPAHLNLGRLLQTHGHHAEALLHLRRAVALAPDHAGFHSNLLYCLWFCPGLSAQDILAEHREWVRRFAASPAAVAPHQNDASPDRPLRVGYVGNLFFEHVVGRHVLCVLENHDPGRFEIVCYSDVARPDGMTQRMRALTRASRDTAHLTHEQLAAQIRADAIDILVDTTLHMPGNRMQVFARRPAPVQFSHFGYPATTGLPAIDARITDDALEPPGLAQQDSAEELVHVPSFWCYRPPRADVPVNDPPVGQRGHITFGCLNNPLKSSPEAIDLWCEVLRKVAGSRFCLLAGQTVGEAYLARHFVKRGIDAGRVKVLPRSAAEQYLRFYHDIDIALDPLPYTGHTTSCDALWMGVPVVTWAGTTGVSRSGASLLGNLGLPQLIADSPARYAEIAVSLAADRPGLARLRRELRGCLEASVIMDAAGHTRALERAYRLHWGRWCAGRLQKA